MTNWNSFFEGILDERLIKVNEPMAHHILMASAEMRMCS